MSHKSKGVVIHQRLGNNDPSRRQQRMFDTEEDNMKAYSRFSLPIVTKKMDEAKKAKRAKDRP